MADDPIQIKRYPNRRYYARHTSKYVSLNEIEDMVQDGATVEIRDSQTGDDITQAVLTQIIMERHPEKMSLFPTDMLHLVLRSNDVMSGFLGDYFRQSQAYMNYLQQQHPTTQALVQPMQWVKAWIDSITTLPGTAAGGVPDSAPPVVPEDDDLKGRVRELEERIRQLETER
jgi:polyhydroxyalkanoate synthesis repressor PhaR